MIYIIIIEVRRTQLEPDFFEYPCFLPLATNIIATPHHTPNTANTLSSIHLQWQLTTKENPDIQYCNGSKRWKVRVLKFSNVADIPRDYEVAPASDDQQSDWFIVPGRKTTYNFTQGGLSTSFFYSFQVEHLGKGFPSSVSPETFASQVHYFGKQRKQLFLCF